MRLRSGLQPGVPVDPSSQLGGRRRHGHAASELHSSKQALPLSDDLLLHALQYALPGMLRWARLRLVCRQFRRCLDAPSALAEFPGLLQVYGGGPNSSLEALVRSRSAAGLRGLELNLEPGSGTEAVQSLIHFRSLQGLKLVSNNSYARKSHAMVTDSCLRALATTTTTTTTTATTTAAQTLISLYIWNAHCITDAGLACIAQLTVLRALTLTHLDSEGVTTHGLCELLPRLAALRDLSLLGCAGLVNLTTLQALYMTGSLRSLHSLDLSDCSSMDDACLAVIARLPNLQKLWLTNCELITDAGLQALAPLGALQELDLSCLRRITDKGLKALAPLTALRHLAVTYCPGTAHSCHETLRQERLGLHLVCGSARCQAQREQTTMRSFPPEDESEGAGPHVDGVVVGPEIYAIDRLGLHLVWGSARCQAQREQTTMRSFGESEGTRPHVDGVVVGPEIYALDPHSIVFPQARCLCT